MLNIKELIFSFIDFILYDNYYQTHFSLDLQEDILLEEEFIYSNSEIQLLLNLINFLAFLKGYNSQFNTIYLIERIENTIIFHRKQKKVYSNNLNLGKLDINYLINEIARVGSFDHVNSIKLKSFYSEYELLENIIFVGILYEVHSKIKITQKNLLSRNPKLSNLKLIQKLNEYLLFLKNILSKPLIEELRIKYITYNNRKKILDNDQLNSIVLSNKGNKIYRIFFRRYLTLIEKEKFFDVEKIDEFKLYEYFVLKSLYKYFKTQGKIDSINPIYNKDKIMEGNLDNKKFEVYYQSSSPLRKNSIEKYILNLGNLKKTNKKNLYGIPDILIKVDNKFVFIDAKYKSAFNLREDIYQMIGYTQLFNLDEYNFMLIYPCKEKQFGGNIQTILYEFYTNRSPVKIIVTCLDDIENGYTLYLKILKDFFKIH